MCKCCVVISSLYYALGCLCPPVAIQGHRTFTTTNVFPRSRNTSTPCLEKGSLTKHEEHHDWLIKMHTVATDSCHCCTPFLAWCMHCRGSSRTTHTPRAPSEPTGGPPGCHRSPKTGRCMWTSQGWRCGTITISIMQKITWLPPELVAALPGVAYGFLLTHPVTWSTINEQTGRGSAMSQKEYPMLDHS